MSFDAQRLYDLLPAIYRIRDADLGSPLRALISVLAEQAQVMEEDLAQLYDNLFIETCAPWVVPYIGDLIGVGTVNRTGIVSASTRAEVANTLRYRRAKGTLLVLEQLAHDTTGWESHSIEYFQLLAATQHTNHVRPQQGALLTSAIRKRSNGSRLHSIGSPAQSMSGTLTTVAADRISQMSGSSSGACKAFRSPRRRLLNWMRIRFLFNPLGINTRLFNRPTTEARPRAFSIPINVPEPLERRLLSAHLDDYYGPDQSILLNVDGNPVVPGQGQQTSDLISACDLSDFGAGWAHVPKNKIAIDPELGRIAFPASQSPKTVSVTFHYGFSAEMGGGEYPRAASFDPLLSPVHQTKSPAKIQDGLNGLAAGGVLEVVDNAKYSETLSIAASTHRFFLRAGDGQRPLLSLSAAFAISGAAGGEVTLNGLLIVGTIHVTGGLSRLTLAHCTIVPAAATPSLIVESNGTTVSIDHSILGGIRTVSTAVRRDQLEHYRRDG